MNYYNYRNHSMFEEFNNTELNEDFQTENDDQTYHNDPFDYHLTFENEVKFSKRL